MRQIFYRLQKPGGVKKRGTGERQSLKTYLFSMHII